MMDLFRVEIENHAATLGRELLKVEKEPSPERIERLMRAAHSVKGAGRIVGLDLAVRLAHAMEDVLAAAGKARVVLTVEAIDRLLQATDIFARLAETPPEAIGARLGQQEARIEELAAGLRAWMDRTPPPTASAPAAAAPAAPPPAKASEGPHQAPTAEPPAAAERADSGFVRVSADNLNRLLGLSGELVVQARTLGEFKPSLQRLKDEVRDLIEELGDAVEADRKSGESGSARTRLESMVEHSERVRGRLLRHMDACEESSLAIERLAGQVYDSVLASRMRPFSEGLHGLPRMVRDLARELGKNVRLDVEGEETPVDRDVLEKMEAPLTHILRNAVDHGIEPPADRVAAGKTPEGRVVLAAEHRAGALHITVTDDGRGIDVNVIRRKIVAEGRMAEAMAASLSEDELLEFLFLPGFSTAERVTEISGRGVGLDVALTTVREIGGAITLKSKPGLRSSIHLRLPLTLSVVRALIVEIGGEPFAFPLSRIDRLVQVAAGDVERIEDRECFRLEEERVGLVGAAEVFQLPGRRPAWPKLNTVVVSDRLNRYGLVVDRFVAARDLVAIPLDARLGKVPNVSAGAVTEDGAPMLILDVDDLVRSVDRLVVRSKPARTAGAESVQAASAKRVLVVDDSLTVREVERKLLTHAGYDVAVAVDGMDGWNVLLHGRFDLVLTDVDMPRMHGLDLIRKIRAYPPFRDLPVLIVSYKDREEDRLGGLEAGASGYLAKSSFHDESLLQAVRDLIGQP
jgi:two-component system sensor histidine kinase and response regulator WspE